MEMLPVYREWEEDDYKETVKAVMEGYQYVKPADEFLGETAQEAWASPLK